MFVAYVVMFMIRQRVMQMAVLRAEHHSRIYLRTGVVLFAGRVRANLLRNR